MFCPNWKSHLLLVFGSETSRDKTLPHRNMFCWWCHDSSPSFSMDRVILSGMRFCECTTKTSTSSYEHKWDNEWWPDRWAPMLAMPCGHLYHNPCHMGEEEAARRAGTHRGVGKEEEQMRSGATVWPSPTSAWEGSSLAICGWSYGQRSRGIRVPPSEWGPAPLSHGLALQTRAWVSALLPS